MLVQTTVINRRVVCVTGGIVQRRSGGSGSMDSGAECETEEDSAPEACVSPEGGPALPR